MNATEISVAEVEKIFAHMPLLRRLSNRQRARLARLATRHSYRPGQVIVRQGDTSVSLYVVLSGSVRIERGAETGSSVHVAREGRGGFFGEMGLIDDAPRAATVTAEEPTECALLAKWDFQTELRHDPDITLTLLPILTQRIRELEARLAREQTVAAI